MAKTKRRRIGDLGEDIACIYLQKRGYTVLERNYWKPWGEIDLVMEKGNTLVFVEVKSVSRESRAISRESIRPEENMHRAKLERLHRAIQTYLSEKNVPETRAWRIDLACVTLYLADRRASVELYENCIL